MASNPNNIAFPLGAYYQNADLSNFNTLTTQWTQLMGTNLQFYDGYVDFGVDPSQWAGNAAWEAGVWKGNSHLAPSTGLTPVIGVPMASNAGGWGNVDNFLKGIINGQYDADYKGIVDAWAKAGYKTVQFRLGYEFNGNWMPWGPGNGGGSSNADFVKAWQHLADLVHQEGAHDGITAQTVWNPSTGMGWNQINGQSPMQLYPGDQYVDIISADQYSVTYPSSLTNWSAPGADGKPTGTASDATTWAANATNREHFWNFPGGTASDPTGGSSQLSLQNLIDFAVQHNKPFSLSESGAGNAKSGAQGPQDDPAFPQWEAQTLANAVNNQGLKVNNVDIWSYDFNGGDNFIGGERPQEAAAWAKYFGANSATTDGINSGGGGNTGVLSAAVTLNAATAGQALPPSTQVATFTDTSTSDPASSFTAVIDWGDGTKSTATVTGSNGSFAVDAGHTYAAAGSDAVSVTVTPSTTGEKAVTANGTVTVGSGSGGGGTIDISKLATAVITKSNTSITATTGDHALFLGGTGDIVTLTAGNEHVYETQGGNTIAVGGGAHEVVMLAGSNNNVVEGGVANKLVDMGTNNTIMFAASLDSANPGLNLYGNVLDNGDKLDLRAVMAATSWDGNMSDVDKFLSVGTNSADNSLDLKLSGHVIADFRNYTASKSLSDILAHAVLK